MKIYALQSRSTGFVNVFLSLHPTGDYLVVGEYDVDITLPSHDEVKALIEADNAKHKADRIQRLKEELEQLEGAA